MTNNWVDLDNSSGFFVIGANPAENHPASIAHLNTARFDTNNRGRNATLVVVDPRQTRTARMIKAGYVATNPNDMRKHDRYVRIRPGTNIAFMNGVIKSVIDWMYANPTRSESVNFFAWHNGTAPNSTAFRQVIADDGTSVARVTTVTPIVPGTTVAGWPKYCDSRIKVDVTTGDYQRTTVTTEDGKSVSNFPLLAADISDPECVFQRLRAHVEKYDAVTAAAISGCTVEDIAAVRDAFIATSRMASSDFGAAGTGGGANSATPTDAGYRAACIMYAMGATQFTTGSQGIRTYAIIQTMLGNMGRAGGGINALRGIHNVQGSTDMGVLFDLIPGYSGNPNAGQSYAAYSNALFGNRVLQTDAGRPTARSPYTPADLGLQQRGFYNMTREWFGSRDITAAADFDKLYACWPKGAGVQHIESFRRMDPAWIGANGGTQIKAAVVWGQNPAVTEPNQGPVRKGLEELDVLVCVDMFANETAMSKRKDTGVTYLLPACSHVEESGSVTSSGRWIQWRDRARAPKGNSKSDLELLLRFARTLNTAGAFSHIQAQWAGTPLAGQDLWTVLYAKYGWDGVSDFEAISLPDAEGALLKGSEYVAEQIFKEMCSPLNAATGPQGTLWIYSGAGNASAYSTDTGDNNPACGISWGKANRAKSRAGAPGQATASLQFPRYGWAWLLNRRIFYNNSELPGDVGDVFVAPGFIARLWCIGGSNTLADWSTLYRAYNQLSDMPDVTTTTGKHVHPGRLPAYTEPYESPSKALANDWGYNTANGAQLIMADSARFDVRTLEDGAASPYPLVLTSIRCVEHFQGGPITRNNPWNVELEPEPWIELNSVDAAAEGIKDGDYVNIMTPRSPLGTADQISRTIQTGALDAGTWNKGFKARVGVGTLANQRVAPGVVAIPWHWGDRGLGTGARANDLCIDSWDANTRIPEYKACMCRIAKVTP
jgi:formate dehydrogenase major subunit